MKKLNFMVFYLVASMGFLGAEDFIFKYRPGDEYRILSQVDQEVYINGGFSHTAYILNRIAVSVQEVSREGGILDASYETSEESRVPGQIYKQDKTYQVRFWRGPRGETEVPPLSFVPTVRNVPFFPSRNIAPGETWTAMASEVHDMRAGLGLEKPVEFPMRVFYRYVGPYTKEGKVYHEIEAQYSVLSRFPRTGVASTQPVQISGNSVQHIFWDSIAGRPEWYEEDFMFVFNLANGNNLVFQGTANARIISASTLDQDSVQKAIEDKITEDSLENVTVRQTEAGLTIAIENIQFAPDSAELLPGEYKKLESLAALLKEIPNHDLLVTGHTALAGDAAGRQRLSEERAQVVGQYLLSNGVRSRDQIMFKGVGALEPLGDNSTEEGRRRNRRVEITILNN